MALCSLILHLKTLPTFCLNCEVDPSTGRISRLSDVVLDGDVIVQWNGSFINYDRDPSYVSWKGLITGKFTTQRHIGFSRLQLLSLADPQTSKEILSWMADKKLPELEKLFLSNIHSSQFETTRTLLCGIDPRITKLFTEIRYHLYSGKMEANHLYTLFVEVLPKFSNLERLKLFYVHVAALQEMLTNMIGLDPLLAIPSAEPLSFDSTPAKRMEIHGLKSFRKIEYLWLSCREEGTDTTDRPLSARSDGCGGDDADDRIGGDNSTGGENQRPRSRVSAWPLVLKRALLLETYNGTVKFDEKDMVDGLYHALRDGPVFLSRCVPDGLGAKKSLHSNEKRPQAC